MLKRMLGSTLEQRAKKFPVVALLGPRQAGKTTLVRHTFSRHHYVSLEDRDERAFALSDPRKFLRDYRNEFGLIIDEIQHVPELLSYIQTTVDEENKPGSFIVTGSHNILLSAAISQTLPGRLALLTLLPLSVQELINNDLLPQTADTLMYTGCYPRLYAQDFTPAEWYPSYIQLYLEREVRQVLQVGNLDTFGRFMGLCAGRTGQIMNITSLANDCGISQATAKSWLSVLHASYIIFFLQPYYKNFSKRVIKSPKLYFYDTGLACSLLRIKSVEQLATHYLRGGLFEGFIVSEFCKSFYNEADLPNLYYWRDTHGHEIDCVIEDGTQVTPVEIKAGETITSNFFAGLDFWNQLTGSDPEKGYVIYGGEKEQHRSRGTIFGWRSLNVVLKGHIL